MISRRTIVSLSVSLLFVAGVACERRHDGMSTERRDTSSSSAGTSGAVSSAKSSTTQSSDAPDKLYGTWVARDVDTKLGEVKIKLVLEKRGPVNIMAWSDLPLVGQVRDKEAPYEATQDTLRSDAIRGGTSMNYYFEGDTLVIEYKDGKMVRFKRAS